MAKSPHTYIKLKLQFFFFPIVFSFLCALSPSWALWHGLTSTGTRAEGSPAGITHLGSALHPSGPQLELCAHTRGVIQPSHLCPGLGATSFLPFSWWGSILWPQEGEDIGLEDQPRGHLNQRWWSSVSAAGFLGVSPDFFFFFWKEVSSFLPVSISSRLLPAHASTNNQKPYHLLKATVDWPQKGLATSSTGLAVDSCSVSQYALSAPGSRNVKATC